jgi:hypothetical protein
MEPNIKPIKIDEIKDENKEIKKKDKTEFIGIYSPNGDNESIYFKFNNISIKNNTSAEIVKITPSHDKEIKEDSIIYFTKKLNKNNIEYHKYLYISIVIFFTDIIIWYFDKQLFHEYFNLYSLLIILGMTIIQIFLFKHNFETITKKVYIFTNRIIYLYIASIIIYLANLTFITYFGIIYNYGKKNHIFKYPMFNLTFFDFTLVLFLYIVTNISIPIIVLVKLISIKRNIKKISSAKGEIYETVKINDKLICI